MKKTAFEKDLYRLDDEIEALARHPGNGPGQRHDAIRQVWLIYQRAMLRGLRTSFDDPEGAGRTIETAGPALRTVGRGLDALRGASDTEQ